ncbi:barstar family protein [Amycolatopsis sp. CA-230715]|uniref:barstar family protein n=1 Tax=Amycolatopsis sp. CA-230715 TaxID=2745196 RepID=UPI001C028EE3|nr:barstar family protein [Amycolatopsis sp. CA-230715]
MTQEELESKAPKNMFVTSFDSRNLITAGELFDRISNRLLFPGYFGRNWPAFDECLSDVYEFVHRPCVVLAFTHSSSLLSCEPSDISILLKIFKKVAAELSKPINIGENWDRPAVSFHVLFDVGIDVASYGS